MISFFYKLTIPRFVSNDNPIYLLINMLVLAEHHIISRICEFFVKYFYSDCSYGLNNYEVRDKKIIVSFTTIPERVFAIPLMLKSIINQSMKPDKIILWITDEIDDRNGLETFLKGMMDCGLEIRYVKDIRVHTKYYYAMQEYPDDLIITVDDDTLYRESLIEDLYKEHLKYPGSVVCDRSHEITYYNKEVKPYNKWRKLAPGTDNRHKNLLATGAGGVLYPPGCLYKDWKDINLFLKLCPQQDDIWLNVMEKLAGTTIVKLKKFTREVFIIKSAQRVALSRANVEEGKNDIQLRNCIDYYGFENIYR